MSKTSRLHKTKRLATRTARDYETGNKWLMFECKTCGYSTPDWLRITVHMTEAHPLYAGKGATR